MSDLPKFPCRWADRLLAWFCSDEHLEILQGDLHELYQHRLETQGRFRARMHYAKDALDMLRPFARKKRKEKLTNNAIAMFKNYLRISFRHMLKNKVYAIVNTVGLVLGITCSLVLFILINYEKSFDDYHENGKHIYRIAKETAVEGSVSYVGGVPIPMLDAVREELVGIQKATIVWSPGEKEIKAGDGEKPEVFHRGLKVAYTDPSFFEIFTWDWVKGDKDKAFRAPNEIVLSRSLSNRIFKSKPAIGQIIHYGEDLMTVVGVMEDAPENSDLTFNAFISMASKANDPLIAKWNVTSESVGLFVQAAPGVSRKDLMAQLPKLRNRVPENLRKRYSEHEGFSVEYILQPLSDYHFDPRFSTFSGKRSSRTILRIYAIVAILLIVTACTNFINMTMAMSTKRSKEVGVHKVLGGSKLQLILRFVLETFGITFMSILLSVMLARIVMEHWVNQLMDVNIVVNPFTDPVLLWGMISILTIITFLAGFIPAISFSRVASVSALRGGLTSGNKWAPLRRSLIVFQLLVAQVLVFGTLVVLKQVDFATSSDLGFDQKFVVDVNLPDNDERTRQLLKSELANATEVESFTFNQNPPISVSERGGPIKVKDRNGNMTQLNLEIKDADDQYLETYQLRLVAGEWLANKKVADRYVINETFARKIGFDNPAEAIGFNLRIWGISAPIVGVVEDFYAKSVHNEIGTMVFWNDPEQYRSLGLKLSATSISSGIDQLEAIWKNLYPNQTLDFGFLDDQIESLYEREKEMSQVLAFFSMITVIIACLGLYGMVSLLASQKAKEVSIRKVLGATVRHVFSSFSMEFIKLITLSFLIAAPFGYFVMNKWLQDFAYSTNIGPTVFLVVITFSAFITLLTTGFRSYKVATANPIDSLRNE